MVTSDRPDAGRRQSYGAALQTARSEVSPLWRVRSLAAATALPRFVVCDPHSGDLVVGCAVLPLPPQISPVALAISMTLLAIERQSATTLATLTGNPQIMAPRSNLPRLFGELLERKCLLSGDGHVSGEHEAGDTEHAEYQPEQSDSHELDAEHEFETGDDRGSDDTSHDSLKLSAKLAGDAGARGEVEYEMESEHGQLQQKLTIQIEGAPANSVHDVTVDGFVVGQVTVDGSGKARLRLDSQPDVNETLLPAGFPDINANSQITVGTIAAGAFGGSEDGGPADDHVVLSNDRPSDDLSGDQTDDRNDDSRDGDTSPDESAPDVTNDDSSGEDSSGDAVGGDDQGAEFEAVLGGDGDAQGRAELAMGAEQGMMRTEFSVRIAGADANTVFDVTVDGVVVGQVATDEFGRAVMKLAEGDDRYPPLPADFPTIQPGSTIKVGDLVDGAFGQDDHNSADVNDDRQVDDRDIDALNQAIAGSSDDDRYDLDRNASVDERDANFLIEVVLDSVVGDANMDGIFDSEDLIEVFKSGQYEDGEARNSIWRTGDWNGDNECDSSDLLFALQRGHYADSDALGSFESSMTDIAQATQDDRAS